MICLSVFGRDQAELLARFDRASAVCDLIEIRFDLIGDCRDVSVPALLAGRASLPLIATNRAGWEGGAFHGKERDRVHLLEEAARAGFSYVDIEMASGQSVVEELRDIVRSEGARLILSYHDFHRTREEAYYLDLFHRMHELGPDVIKIVSMARDEFDFMRLASIYPVAKGLEQPVVAFCMGDMGRCSRILCLCLGALFTFSCLDEDAASAPGQIPVSIMKPLVSMLM